MKLNAYSYDAAWKLEPATNDRDWFKLIHPSEAACLPMAMASQAGWFIKTPVAFKMRWNGSVDKSGLEILVEDEAYKDYFRSDFGTGIVTIYFPLVFDSDAGMELLCRPPSNFIRRGLVGLEGIVETGWSPYSFTMNWKVTELNTWVGFEAGDPIAMLVPMCLGMLEKVQTSLRPFNEFSRKAEFDAWMKKRHQVLEEGLPRQGGYLKGECPVTGARAAGHKVKLNLGTFEADPRELPKMQGYTKNWPQTYTPVDLAKRWFPKERVLSEAEARWCCDKLSDSKLVKPDVAEASPLLEVLPGDTLGFEAVFADAYGEVLRLIQGRLAELTGYKVGFTPALGLPALTTTCPGEEVFEPPRVDRDAVLVQGAVRSSAVWLALSAGFGLDVWYYQDPRSEEFLKVEKAWGSGISNDTRLSLLDLLLAKKDARALSGVAGEAVFLNKRMWHRPRCSPGAAPGDVLLSLSCSVYRVEGGLVMAR